VPFTRTSYGSSVFLQDYEILPGVASAAWGTGERAKFVENLREFLDQQRNGFDITHQGAVRRTASCRLIEFDTPRRKSFERDQQHIALLEATLPRRT